MANFKSISDSRGGAGRGGVFVPARKRPISSSPEPEGRNNGLGRQFSFVRLNRFQSGEERQGCTCGSDIAPPRSSGGDASSNSSWPQKSIGDPEDANGKKPTLPPLNYLGRFFAHVRPRLINYINSYVNLVDIGMAGAAAVGGGQKRSRSVLCRCCYCRRRCCCIDRIGRFETD